MITKEIAAILAERRNFHFWHEEVHQEHLLTGNELGNP